MSEVVSGYASADGWNEMSQTHVAIKPWLFLAWECGILGSSVLSAA